MLLERKMVERKKITVKFETSQRRGSIEMLRAENLSKLGIGAEEIASITTSFAFPGYLYPEQNVATLTHPCAGSACATITNVNGSEFGIDEIFYYDKNIHQTHYNGKPHWNHERRFKTPERTWIEKGEEEFHQIPDSEEIKISLFEEDKLHGTKIIKRSE